MSLGTSGAKASAMSREPMLAMQWSAKFTWTGLEDERSFFMFWTISFIKSLRAFTITDMNKYPWNYFVLELLHIGLYQGFPKGGDFCQLGGAEFWYFWRWTYTTRYFGVADEEQKKKVLAVYISNFEAYSWYFGVADEKQKTNKS